jgi:hypothetical protein
MTDDLFPDCKQGSPRLAWMKKHGVTTELVGDAWRAYGTFVHHVDYGKIPDKSEIDEPVLLMADQYVFYLIDGASEDEALSFWAKEAGIPLWNEEAYKNET